MLLEQCLYGVVEAKSHSTKIQAIKFGFNLPGNCGVRGGETTQFKVLKLQNYIQSTILKRTLEGERFNSPRRRPGLQWQ